MKKFLLAATAAAALSAMSTAAFAVVDLDDGTGSANFARELVVAGTTALTGAGVDVTATLGFGVSDLQTRFIRFDLGNAEFGADVDINDLSFLTGNATVAVSQGGTTGDDFVILQISATGGIAQDDTVQFAMGTGVNAGGVVIQAANAPVAVTYSLYEDAPSAAAGGAAGRLSTTSATVAGLVSGLSFKTTPNTTTVDVAASPSYTKFLPSINNTTTTIAQIGTVSIGAATPVLDPDTGVQVLYGDLVAAGTKLVLTGDDLTAAVAPATGSEGLFLAPDGTDCTTAGIAATAASRTATSASFTINDIARVDAPLCFTVKAANTAPIAQQNFNVMADITAEAGSTTADTAPLAAGAFKRNGLVLKAAFAEATSAAGVSSAVHLTNTSGMDAPYTVRCMLNSGVISGTADTLPANSASRKGVTASLGCPADGTLRGVEITFSTTPGSVIGSVVRQNTTTGQASFDAMTGNQ